MSSIADESSDHLLRSAADIGRVLDALAAHRASVTAQLQEEGTQFRSQLIFADPQRQFIIVSVSADQADNAALLACPRVMFHSALGGWHFEFAASEPCELMQ